MIARTYPSLFALVGDLFAANLEAGLPEGAVAEDAADHISSVADGLIELHDEPNRPFRMDVEPDKHGYGRGFKPVEGDDYYAVNKHTKQVQTVCPLGLVTIEAAKAYDPSDNEPIIVQWKREQGE